MEPDHYLGILLPSERVASTGDGGSLAAQLGLLAALCHGAGMPPGLHNLHLQLTDHIAVQQTVTLFVDPCCTIAGRIDCCW